MAQSYGMPARIGLALMATGASAYMTWAAWRGPPQRDFAAIPPPIARSADAADVLAVERSAAEMTEHIQSHPAAQAGMPLEALLASPIPDNPLVEGVGTTAVTCTDVSPPPTVDWLFCPERKTVTAVIPR